MFSAPLQKREQVRWDKSRKVCGLLALPNSRMSGVSPKSGRWASSFSFVSSDRFTRFRGLETVRGLTLRRALGTFAA